MKVGLFPTLSIIGVVFTVYLIFIYVSSITRYTVYRKVGGLALTGRLLIIVFVIPNLPYRWDILKFHRVATSLISGVPIDASMTVGSFAAFQAIIYAAFGADPTVVAVVNSLFAVLLALPAADIAHRLYPTLESTEGVIATVLLLPLPYLFLTIPLRDALTVTVFFTLVALLIRGYDTYRLELWLPALPLFGMLSLLRPELAFITLGGVTAGAVVHMVDTVSKDPVPVRTLVGVGLPLGLITVPVVGPRLPVDRIAGMLENRTVGGAAYLKSITYENWVDLVLFAPARALYFQFAPFPLHVTSVFDLLAVTMTPVLIVLAVGGFRSARSCERATVVLVGLATTYLLGIVGYGLVDSNFGTTVRHRIPFTFMLVVFAAPVLPRWEKSLREWIGQRPRHDDGQDEQQSETQELHGSVGVRAEDAD